MQCDILVAGGGSAGLAAAITAARAGAKTLLVEELGALGGMATAALVHSICGLYRITASQQPVWANEGFPVEFAKRLLGESGADGPVRMGRLDVLLTQPTAFARLADTMVQETSNLTLWLHSKIVHAESDLSRVETSTRGQRHNIHPKAVIDATGDGTMAAICGAAFEQESADHLQRPAFIFGMQNVDHLALSDDARLRISQQIVAGVQNGVLTKAALGATLRASGRAGEAFVSIDLCGSDKYDPLDPVCLTALEMEGRATANALTVYLREKVSGFKTSFISLFPARVGIRESRRIAGQYRLETADVENGATFEDGIALATWPMELRETARGPRLRYPKNDLPCEIPLRSLRAREHANLYMAGRCISCSHEAQASIRVIGTCLATGAAAGRAAAHAL